MSDHYAALGLSPSASAAEIKQAFRQRAAQYHPDRNPDPNAPALFRKVQAAYDVLGDAEKRRLFDENRRRNLLDDPLSTAREIWHAYFSTLDK